MSLQSLNGNKKENDSLSFILNDDSEGTYFDKSGKFLVTVLGKEVMQEITIITTMDNQTMFFYDEDTGIWLPNGETKAREIIKRKLGMLETKHYADETVYYIRYSTLKERNIFDEPGFLIPCDNGILNINEMTFFPYSPTFHFQFKHPVYYDKKATCPLTEKFLSEIVNSERDILMLKEIIAYCLWRSYPIQKGVMCVGEGENGKSVYLGLIRNILGNTNTSSVSLQELETDRFAKETLYQKNANIYADLSDDAVKHTGTFKMLTGGDQIQAQKKYGQPFVFVNYSKLIFSCNKMPLAYDDSTAFYRRWVIMPFPNSFEGRADKNILSKLSSSGELSGLLNQLLPILKDLLKRGEFSYEKTSEELRDEYIRMSDSVHAFVIDMVEVSTENTISKERFYQEYCDYCRDKNLIPIAKNKFGEGLSRHISIESCNPRIDGKQVHSWKGIKLKGIDVPDATDSGSPLPLTKFGKAREEEEKEKPESTESTESGEDYDNS